MGKAGKVQKEKTNKLEEELVMVKKENARLLCEKMYFVKQIGKSKKWNGRRKF